MSSGLLRCRWQQSTGRESDYLQRVLPDGCADVLVDAQDDAILVGPTALPAVVRLAAGTAYQCVRLRPGMLRHALGIPADLLVDEVLALEEVVDTPTTRRLTRAARGDDRALQQLEAQWNEVPAAPRLRGVLAWLNRHPDQDVARLAAATGLSTRQLRRLLSTHAGLGPKLLQRVFRCHRFLRAAEAHRPTASLAALAAHCGYADQAHLSREMRTLTGLPPAALLRERRATRQFQ